MNIKIGKKIKELRGERRITQEQLATFLGVTPQAISRWEAGNGYPDIETLPALSDYFGITSDELLGIKKDEREVRILELENELGRCFDTGTDDEYLAATRRAVAEFPSSREFQNRLLGALIRRAALSEQECENRGDLLIEAEHLGHALLNGARGEEERSDIVESLVTLYSYGFEDNKKAVEIADTVTPMKYSREILKSHAIKGCAGRYCHDAIESLVNNLDTVIMNLVLTDKNADAETSVSWLRKSEQIIEILYGDDLHWFHQSIIYDEYFSATLLLDLGRTGEALDALEKMYEHIVAFDAFLFSDDYGQTFDPPSSVYDVLEDYEFEHTQCHHIKQRLQSDVFDPIRDSDRFRAIITMLEEHER